MERLGACCVIWLTSPQDVGLGSDLVSHRSGSRYYSRIVTKPQSTSEAVVDRCIDTEIHDTI
jgi:hypothetical protein